MTSITEFLKALAQLPSWVQLAWAVWAVVGIGLLIPTINLSRVTSSLTAGSAEKPVLGEIDVGLPYGYFMKAAALKDGRELTVYGQPSRTITRPLDRSAQDIVLSFDITNPNKLDLRVSGVYVEVLDFIPVRVIETEPVEAAGKIRRFYCNIRSSKGLYQAELANDSFDYVKLSEGELENIAINVNSPDPGIYSLAISVEYSIASTSLRVGVGRVPRLVGFF